MPNRQLAAISVATLTAIAIVMVTAQAGCGGPTKRARTLQAVLISVNAARDGLTEYDKQQGQRILDAPTREEYTAEVAAYTKARAPVLQAFEVAYKALAVAALNSDETSFLQAKEAVKDLMLAIGRLTGKGTP